MKHLFIFLVVFNCVDAQQILMVDTLQYNSVTRIVGLAPTENHEIIILGGHSTSYSNPNNASGRTFVLKTEKNNAFSVLDSAIGGVGTLVGPAVHKQNIYVVVWLNALNSQIPKIGGIPVDAGIYLIKYNATGKLIWYKKQGFHAIPAGISTDTSGFLYVSYEGIMGFRKYSSEGEQLDNQFPLPGSTFDLNGNFYSHFDSYLYKFDPKGTQLFKLYIGAYGTFKPDDFGNIFLISGPVLRKIDQSGNELWKTSMPFYNCTQLRVEDQNLYVSGRFGKDVWTGGTSVAKIDENSGNVIWNVELLTDSSGWTYFPSALTSNHGYVFIASTPDDIGVADTYLTRIEDMSYIPVTTSIKQQQNESGPFKIIPNPSSGNVTLYLSDEIHGKYMVQITDLAGRVVLQKEFEHHLPQNIVIISTNHLSAGIYNIQLLTENHFSAVSRLVVGQ